MRTHALTSVKKQWKNYETCFMSQPWCLEFLDGPLNFWKFVHDWCGGVVVYLHLFLTSTLHGVVNCSLLITAALFPRDAAPDTPLIGGREGHRSRLDAFGQLKNFCLWQGIEPCNTKCRLHEVSVFQSHSVPAQYVGYSTVQTASNH